MKPTRICIIGRVVLDMPTPYRTTGAADDGSLARPLSLQQAASAKSTLWTSSPRSEQNAPVIAGDPAGQIAHSRAVAARQDDRPPLHPGKMGLVAPIRPAA